MYYNRKYMWLPGYNKKLWIEFKMQLEIYEDEKGFSFSIWQYFSSTDIELNGIQYRNCLSSSKSEFWVHSIVRLPSTEQTAVSEFWIQKSAKRWLFPYVLYKDWIFAVKGDELSPLNSDKSLTDLSICKLGWKQFN